MSIVFDVWDVHLPGQTGGGTMGFPVPNVARHEARCVLSGQPEVARPRSGRQRPGCGHQGHEVGMEPRAGCARRQQLVGGGVVLDRWIAVQE